MDLTGLSSGLCQSPETGKRTEIVPVSGHQQTAHGGETEPLKIHEEFYDGKLFTTTNRDEFVVQVYMTYDKDVFIMNAFTPLIDRFCRLVPAGGKANAQ